MLGANLWELFPAALADRSNRSTADGRTRVTETVEGYYPEPEHTWFEVRVLATARGSWLTCR